jgi:hypothetical protein
MTLYVVSQRVFIVVSVYFVIDSVRKLLVTPLYLLCLNLASHADALKNLRIKNCRKCFTEFNDL